MILVLPDFYIHRCCSCANKTIMWQKPTTLHPWARCRVGAPGRSLQKHERRRVSFVLSGIFWELNPGTSDGKAGNEFLHLSPFSWRDSCVKSQCVLGDPVLSLHRSNKDCLLCLAYAPPLIGAVHFVSDLTDVLYSSLQELLNQMTARFCGIPKILCQFFNKLQGIHALNLFVDHFVP